MANKFQIKRTTVAGRTANTTSAANTSFIDKGELAFNLADRKLYSSDTSNTLFEVGANLTTLSVSSTLTVTGNSTLSGNTVVVSPTIGTLSSTTKALDVYPPTLASTHEPRNFVMFRDMYNAGVNGQYLQIKSFSSGVSYGGWHILSNWGGKIRLGASANNAAEANNYPSTYAEISTTALSTTGLTFSTGNTTVTGDLTVTGNTTLGDAATDKITINANSITIAANANIDVGTLYIDSSNDRVGVGTTTPGYKLEVNGSFAATTKSFLIDHPTKSGMRLRYGSLEGPENGVYVRGRLNSSDTIELPDYWTGLVDANTITVNITPIGSHQKLFVKDIINNTITIGNENLLSKEINCFYTVFAERNDVEKLVVEYKEV